MSHDRAQWDLGRASSDVIEGHGSKHSRDVDWVSSAVKTYLGYLCFIFCRKWTRVLNERSISSSNAIWSLATFSTATMYKYFFDFEVRVASRVRHTASHDRQFAGRLIKVKTMAEELTYNYWGVIKMSVNTNIFAEKFVF